MKFLPSMLAFVAATSGAWAQGLIMVKPMPPADVAMELRSGLSSADVAQDVKQHRLTRPPTAEELKAIQQAGASAELLALVQSAALAVTSATSTATKPAATPKASPDAPPVASSIEGAPRFWIFGFLVKETPNGGALVSCRDIKPDAQLSPLPRSGDEFVYFKNAPAGKKTSDGQTLINCEAALIGKLPMRSHDGKVIQVASLQLVKDLTPAPGEERASPAAPPRPPARRQAVITQGGWNALRALGGPDAEMKLLGIDFDSIRVRFKSWPATRVVPIERGSDARTLLFDDGKGCSVFYIDSLSRPDNGGVFEFLHLPSSATYPLSSR